jgi:hypothetical protein
MRVSFAIVSCAVTLSGLAVAHASPSTQCPTRPLPGPIAPPQPYAAATSVDAYLPSVVVNAAIDAHIDITATPDSNVSATVEQAPPAPAFSSAGYASSSAGSLTSETPLTTVHWEGALAMAIAMDWSTDINVHAAFGLQVDAVRIAAEYTMSKAHTETMDPTSTWRMISHWGQNQRLGLAGRYRLDTGASEFGVGLYAEAGVGINLTNWAKQADTRQGDVMLGLGGEFLVGEHKRLGMDFGFRFIMSEGVTADEPRALATIFTMGMLVGK